MFVRSLRRRSIIKVPQFATTTIRSQLFFFSSFNKMSQEYKVSKSESEWQAILSPEQFRVLRLKGTEPPGTGEYDKVFEPGVYTCAACDAPLYKAETKFDSGCGWPAFYEAIPGSIKLFDDASLGRLRTEMVCANCGGHLGHVFKGEGFKTPTDERHCVNSISIKLKPAEKA